MYRTGSIGSSVGPAVIEHRLALEIAPGLQRGHHRVGNALGLGEPARPYRAARQKTLVRLDDGVTPLPQRFHVVTGGGVTPHIVVHRRSEDDGTGEGQVDGGEEIVGDAGGELGEQVRRGRSDYEDVTLLRDADVFYRARERIRTWVRREQAGDHLAAGEGGEGERPDELLRRLRHHHLDGRAAFDERSRQFRGLIGGDAAADAQDHVHTGPGSEVLLLLQFQGGRSGDRVVVFHQSAADFFDGRDRGLLRGGGQERPRTALQAVGRAWRPR